MSGLSWRRSVKVDETTRVNMSTGGVSASKKVGRVRVNSRGGGSIRIAPGLSFRFGKRR